MNSEQKKLLLSQIKFAMGDRRIDKVAEATGMSKITVTKARNGNPTLNAGSITVLCRYLGIDIPTD